METVAKLLPNDKHFPSPEWPASLLPISGASHPTGTMMSVKWKSSYVHDTLMGRSEYIIHDLSFAWTYLLSLGPGL